MADARGVVVGAIVDGVAYADVVVVRHDHQGAVGPSGSGNQGEQVGAGNGLFAALHRDRMNKIASKRRRQPDLAEPVVDVGPRLRPARRSDQAPLHIVGRQDAYVIEQPVRQRDRRRGRRHRKLRRTGGKR